MSIENWIEKYMPLRLLHLINQSVVNYIPSHK